MSYRLGVDIGGTFTDFVIVNDRDGQVAIHKQLTSSDDPSRAVLEGIDTILKKSGISISELIEIIHGTTLITNALIERKGCRTGLLVTKGMRDVLDIGRERRYDLFDLRITFPEPIVPKQLRRVFPFMREYERWTTTSMNAYVQPAVDRYIGKLEKSLEDQHFVGRFYVMTSSGGMVATQTARKYPIRLLESGPAAGAIMSAYHGRMTGADSVLSFDMGGTTAKGALIRGGQPLKTYETEVARVHEFKAGSGLPAKAPSIDMIEIGSGGGSIAEIDERGVIRVGPKSSSSVPGPACYSLGGKQPTLTDANLVLGYLDPNFFLGGRMKLDKGAAEAVIDANIGRPLSLDSVRGAWGIHEIVNEDIARAFRVHASERGFDYRHTSMVGFGGSGPMHAARVARKLKVPRIVFPMGAGVMSAFGLLISPISFELVASKRMSLCGLTERMMNNIFLPMENKATAILQDSVIDGNSIVMNRKVDMRYEGQGYEIEIPANEGPDELFNSFEAEYKSIFTSITSAGALEVVNWKLEASTQQNREIERFEFPPHSTTDPIKNWRSAFFAEPNDYIETPVYDRYALKVGDKFKGPAIIEENESTIVIGVKDEVEIDQARNIIVKTSSD